MCLKFCHPISAFFLISYKKNQNCCYKTILYTKCYWVIRLGNSFYWRHCKLNYLSTYFLKKLSTLATEKWNKPLSQKENNILAILLHKMPIFLILMVNASYLPPL